MRPPAGRRVQVIQRRISDGLMIKPFPTLIIAVVLWSTHGSSVLAEELKGQVHSTQLQGTSTSNLIQGGTTSNVIQGETTSNVIQGGIKNEATLNPSLKVIPGQAKKFAPLRAETPQYFFPTGVKLTQFHGSSQIPAPDASPEPPLFNKIEQYKGSSRIGHPIAPISSYTLTPSIGIQEHRTSGTTAYSSQSGVTSYVPGLETTKVTIHPSVSSYVPGNHIQAVTTYGGITDYSRHGGEIIQPVRPINEAIHGSMRAVPGPVSKEGVTAYAPGYASISVPTIRGALSSSTPGHSFFSPATFSSVTQRNPGYEITIKTPRNGVVSWDSRYESTTVNTGLVKNTLGGMWYSNQGVRPEEGQRANTQSLPFKPMFAQAIVGPNPHPLNATALGLPGVHPIVTTELTWDEWYKRVARAVYTRWQTEDVGPGRATVSVTVTRDRMVAGKVIEFTPAPDVERDAAAETSFKEAALNAVNLVSQFEIPEFPQEADTPSVTFDVDLKRDVDGPVGFDVAAIPGSSPAKAESGIETKSIKTEKNSNRPKNATNKANRTKAKTGSGSASKKAPAAAKPQSELKMEVPQID